MPGVRIVLAASLLLFAGAAAAQTDWLQKGKDLLGNIGKGGGDSAAGAAAGALGTDELTAGLKEALRVGTGRVVSQLGKTDGFNADSTIRIPLPESMQTVRSTLQPLGMSGMLDDLETRLNRAAEAATPQAQELFVQAISEMTLDDAKAIYDGPADAATRYFESKMSAPLADAMRPIVDDSLAEVGAIKAYDNLMGQYRSVPLVPDVKADLTNHVLDKGMDGIFHYVAQEEAAIRANPAARTTDILKRVFGSSS